jgi:hypothetical protein
MRKLRITLIVAGGLLLAVAAALAGMLAFGTAAAPVELASLGAPFRHVDFSDLPAVQKLPVKNRSPIAFHVWEPPQSVDAPKRSAPKASRFMRPISAATATPAHAAISTMPASSTMTSPILPQWCARGSRTPNSS